MSKWKKVIAPGPLDRALPRKGHIWQRGGLELIPRGGLDTLWEKGAGDGWAVRHAASGLYVSPLRQSFTFREAKIYADSIIPIMNWRARHVEPTPELKAALNMRLLMLGKEKIL